MDHEGIYESKKQIVSLCVGETEQNIHILYKFCQSVVCCGNQSDSNIRENHVLTHDKKNFSKEQNVQRQASESLEKHWALLFTHRIKLFLTPIRLCCVKGFLNYHQASCINLMKSRGANSPTSESRKWTKTTFFAQWFGSLLMFHIMIYGLYYHLS